MKHLENLLLIIFILPISSTLSFSFVAPTISAACGRTTTRSSLAASSPAAAAAAATEDTGENNSDSDKGGNTAISSSTYNNNAGLKSHLPTPKKRSPSLDKLGRRIYDLKDDDDDSSSDTASSATAAEVVAALKSDKELAADASSAGFSYGDAKTRTDATPSTSRVSLKSQKELAAIASSKDFVNLKELLPVQKTTFMEVDKFGKRLQRMADDGTVNIKKEPTEHRPQQQVAPSSQSLEEAPAAAQINSPALASFLGKKVEKNEPFTSGVDLKELLPKQNMRFLKLDKFGRRVQRMEDDGTVNMKREPEAASVDLGSDNNNYGSLKTLLRSKEEDKAAAYSDINNKYGSLKKYLVKEDVAVDLDSDKKYGSLKELLPTKRATWTMLDVKGASVEDTRRTQNKDIRETSSNSGGGGIGGSLKDLMPKRETWTRLDFKGASVPDERRTRTNTSSTGSVGGTFNAKGQYSSLKTLLPARTITWKNNQVLSSGSAASVSTTMREGRQQAMKNDVIASAEQHASDSDDVDAVDSDSDATDSMGSSGEEEKPYSNLKDLLPERKFTWRTTK